MNIAADEHTLKSIDRPESGWRKSTALERYAEWCPPITRPVILAALKGARTQGRRSDAAAMPFNALNCRQLNAENLR